MLRGLPQDKNDLFDWSWELSHPCYEELARRTLDSNSVLQWLADWTAVRDRVTEWQIRLQVLTSQYTADKQGMARYLDFVDEVYARAESAEQQLRERLLARNLKPQGFSVPLLKMRTAARLSRCESAFDEQGAEAFDGVRRDNRCADTTVRR